MNLDQAGVSTHKVRGEEDSEFVFHQDDGHGRDPRKLTSTRAQLPSPLEGVGGRMRGKRTTNAALLDRAAHSVPATATAALAVQPHSILPPPALGVAAASSSAVDGGALHAGADQEALYISFEVEAEHTCGEGATAEEQGEEEEAEDLWEDVDGEPAPLSVSAIEVKLERAEREAAEGAASDAEGDAHGAESEVRCAVSVSNRRWRVSVDSAATKVRPTRAEGNGCAGRASEAGPSPMEEAVPHTQSEVVKVTWLRAGSQAGQLGGHQRAAD
jgi:hypothetical protein